MEVTCWMEVTMLDGGDTVGWRSPCYVEVTTAYYPEWILKGTGSLKTLWGHISPCLCECLHWFWSDALVGITDTSNGDLTIK